MRNVGRSVAVVLLAAVATGVQAQATDRSVRVWAAGCVVCHGSAAAVGASKMPLLNGRSERELSDALLSFRAGTRAGTVMPQLSKGYSEEELRRLARHFAVAAQEVQP